jgi:hypothetical protein
MVVVVAVEARFWSSWWPSERESSRLQEWQPEEKEVFIDPTIVTDTTRYTNRRMGGWTFRHERRTMKEGPKPRPRGGGLSGTFFVGCVCLCVCISLENPPLVQCSIKSSFSGEAVGSSCLFFFRLCLGAIRSGIGLVRNKKTEEYWTVGSTRGVQ